MIKGTDQQERIRYEDIEEQEYKIGSQGEAFKRVKDQKIDEIDKRQDF